MYLAASRARSAVPGIGAAVDGKVVGYDNARMNPRRPLPSTARSTTSPWRMTLRRVAIVALAPLAVGATIAGCKKEATAPVAAPAAPAAAPPAPAAAAPAAYAPRVEVAVTDEGFVPSKIPAKAGETLTLAITRKTEKTCATEIIFKGQEGKTDLPMGKTVEVAYTPRQSGNVAFGCAMGMMIGGVLEVAD